MRNEIYVPSFGTGVFFMILGLLGCYLWAGCAFVSFYHKRILLGSALIGAALLTGWAGVGMLLISGN